MRDNPITLHPGTPPVQFFTPPVQFGTEPLPTAPVFTGPAVLMIPPMAERTSYKKKKGSSDTAHTKDEIVT